MYKCNLTPKHCIDRFHLTFEDEAPSNGIVYNWFAEFQRGRTFLNDEFRESRPSTSVVTTNVDVVRQIIERDQHVTYCEIQASLGIDMKAIHTILHDYLNVEQTEIVASSFIMITPAVTQHIKPLIFYQVKMSN